MAAIKSPAFNIGHAEVAELVDALASGASGGNPVEVQVLFSAFTGASAVFTLPRSFLDAPDLRSGAKIKGITYLNPQGPECHSTFHRLGNLAASASGSPIPKGQNIQRGVNIRIVPMTVFDTMKTALCLTVVF